MPRPLYSIAVSEEYCCFYAYLRLCRARGETKRQLSKTTGVSINTIKENYRQLNAGKHTCQNVSFCMKAQIDQIEDEMKKARLERRALDGLE